MKRDTLIGTVALHNKTDEDTLFIDGDEIIPVDANWEDGLPNYPSPDNTPLDRHQLMQQIHLEECQLSPRNIKMLKDIIWRHKSAFYEYDNKVGLYNGPEKLSISLKTDVLPPRIRPNRMSKEKEEEVEKQISDMLKSGMIENSRSPYLSRVVLVRKKDNKWRFVVDFRNINKLISEQSHHIPRIDRIVEEAAGKLFFTNFDLKNGFHQIPLDNDSKRIAAFATHLGIFQYRVMPMGLAGSPDTFQRIMEDIYSRVPNVHIYLDDLLTCSNDENEHLASIDSILKLTTKYNLKFSLSKCKFAQPHVMYLGFILDKHGIRPNPDKVKAILDKTPPRNEKELKSFLGAVSYFRKHIENFSKSASSLYDIVNNFQWKDIHTRCFNELKNKLANAAILAPPDHTQPYTIYTDASFQGLGACLVQNNRPIAFAARSLSKAEKNYPIIKLEALGLVYALKQFRPYIYGKRTVVITDHKPLLALLQSKELNNILQRYQMSIMEYDLEIRYIKGEENHIADYLSRDTFNNLEEVFPSVYSWLQQPYYINQFEKYMSDDEKSQLEKKPSPGNRCYVPIVLRHELLRRYHIHPLLGKHFGYEKEGARFKQLFYWKNMDQDIMKVWTACEDCAINKHQPSRNLHPAIKQHPVVPEPWHTLNADFLTIDEHHHVLVIIDDFSKFAFARLTKNQGALTTIKILKECFTILGFPQVLRSDNGAAFKSEVLVKYLEDNRIQQYLSSAYNHKSNGLVERYNRNIRESLRLFKGQSFDDIILHTTYGYNHSRHTTMKAIPAKIIMNIPDKFIGETYINNQMSGYIDIIKWSQQFNNNVDNAEKETLPNGTMVWKRIMGHTDKSTNAKNQPQFDGPFKIVQHLHGDTYEIIRSTRAGRQTGKPQRIHASFLKRFNTQNAD